MGHTCSLYRRSDDRKYLSIAVNGGTKTIATSNDALHPWAATWSSGMKVLPQLHGV